MSDPPDKVGSGIASRPRPREVSQDMCSTTVPATAAEALAMLESAAGLQESALAFLAAQDTAALPGQAAADQLRALERHNAVEAAVRGRLLAVFDAQDGHLADGQRSTRTWLVHSLRVTRGQAGEYQAVQALARSHRVLHAALAEGWVITTSEALQLARWTRAIPGEYRAKAEELLVAPPGPGRTCEAWPRSAPRSAPTPPGPTPTTTTTPAWTAASPWTPRSTAPASSTVTSPPTARRWSRPSWTPCPAPQAAGTCGPAPSGTTTRSPRR